MFDTTKALTQESALPFFNQLGDHLLSNLPFIMYLHGPLGAGKTYAVGHILRRLHLDPRIPVTSPTYSYKNVYETDLGQFTHLDLYRLQEGYGALSFEDLDLYSSEGLFIEWPEALPFHHDLSPTHTLTISYVTDTSRSYTLSIQRS